MNQENLEDSLLHIRQAAKEYYTRKSGTWKPKRDLDAERLEDEARFRRESMSMFDESLHSVMRMMRYSSGPERMTVRHDISGEIERVRSAFACIDFSSVEVRTREVLEAKRDLIPTGPSHDMVVIDELPTSRRMAEMPELKDYQHRFLYGDWSAASKAIGEFAEEVGKISTSKLGAGKNPMAEHTIRAVKKSHRKRRFSQKSK